MIPESVIEQVRQIPITEFLEKLGFRCVERYGGNYRYENPLRQEANPSFDVNPNKNVWIDRGTNEGGNIIKLMVLLKKCSFPEAVKILSEDNIYFSFRRPDTSGGFTTDKSKIYDFEVKALSEPKLFSYLTNRKIDINVAAQYVKEAHYKIEGLPSTFYAIAFPSRKGGYELRSANFKGCYFSKSISAFKASCSTPNLLLFEGFMDFLSYLTRQHSSFLQDHVIVLNSLTLLTDSLIEKISRFTVHAFLDNDTSSKKAIAKLEKKSISLVDHSFEYQDYKDYNEYHIYTSH